MSDYFLSRVTKSFVRANLFITIQGTKPAYQTFQQSLDSIGLGCPSHGATLKIQLRRKKQVTWALELFSLFVFKTISRKTWALMKVGCTILLGLFFSKSAFSCLEKVQRKKLLM